MLILHFWLILEVSIASSCSSHKLTMKSQWLVGVLRTELSIGLVETHGVPIGEKMVSSELRCTVRI